MRSSIVGAEYPIESRLEERVPSEGQIVRHMGPIVERSPCIREERVRIELRHARFELVRPEEPVVFRAGDPALHHPHIASDHADMCMRLLVYLQSLLARLDPVEIELVVGRADVA